MAGRSLPHALLMMIPEPWSNHESMSPERKAFYHYHASLMEPWDGPASIAFTDGKVIGAVLDRNGLRPSRYYVTKDDLVIMASEVGVLDVEPQDVLVKERLHPGKIFLVDTVKGRIVDDEEIKRELAAEHPYQEWLDQQLIDINDLPAARAELPEHETVFKRQQAFGYTQEDLRFLIAPMAMGGEEPIGSMGTDTSLAVLSDKPRLLYEYFKQLFAQVTNPPLDAIREELVTDMGSTIGPERNLLKAGAGVVPADQDQVPDHPQRARREAASSAAEHAVPLDDAVDAVRSGERRSGARAGDGRSLPAGQRSGCRRLRHPHPVGSRRQPDAGADSQPAGHGRRAPSPGARGHAHALCAGRRVGRRPRGASRLAAARLRRRRRQPVRGVRDHRRHDPSGDAHGHRARHGDRALHQGPQQGRAEGDVEDGDLDAAELLRRADLRGHRPEPGVHRQVLHAHDVAHRRRRHRHRRRGSGDSPRARVRPAAGAAAGARGGRGVPVAPRRRIPPVQPGHGVQAAARHAQRPIHDLQGVLTRR